MKKSIQIGINYPKIIEYVWETKKLQNYFFSYYLTIVHSHRQKRRGYIVLIHPLMIFVRQSYKNKNL